MSEEEPTLDEFLDDEAPEGLEVKFPGHKPIEVGYEPGATVATVIATAWALTSRESVRDDTFRRRIEEVEYIPSTQTVNVRVRAKS